MVKYFRLLLVRIALWLPELDLVVESTQQMQRMQWKIHFGGYKILVLGNS